MPAEKDRWGYGGFYLAKRHNNPNWHRCWFDAAAKQTRAATLGTRDFEEAQRLLIAYVHEFGKIDTTRADELRLWEVLQRYSFQHVRHLSKRSAESQRHNLDMMRKLAGDIGVVEFRLSKQAEIVGALKAAGYADGYIKRIFSATYAALKWAFDNEEVDRIPARLKLPAGGAREYVATPAALAALWDELAEEHLRMFFVLALSTAGRKSAVLQLTRFQCDLARGLVDLNQPDRTRNRKRRAIVPMTRVARAWIAAAEDGPLVAWHGKPIADVKIGWRAARERAGLPAALSPHALRHTVASWCRMQSVDSWKIAALGGWREPGAGTVDRYAKYDPEYFRPVIAAIDNLFDAIAESAKTGLNPHQRASDVRESLETGAGKGIRTPDPHLGKVMLYP